VRQDGALHALPDWPPGRGAGPSEGARQRGCLANDLRASATAVRAAVDLRCPAARHWPGTCQRSLLNFKVGECLRLPASVPGGRVPGKPVSREIHTRQVHPGRDWLGDGPVLGRHYTQAGSPDLRRRVGPAGAGARHSEPGPQLEARTQAESGAHTGLVPHCAAGQLVSSTPSRSTVYYIVKLARSP
jgi:hypothetical protein